MWTSKKNCHLYIQIDTLLCAAQRGRNQTSPLTDLSAAVSSYWFHISRLSSSFVNDPEGRAAFCCPVSLWALVQQDHIPHFTLFSPTHIFEWWLIVTPNCSSHMKTINQLALAGNAWPWISFLIEAQVIKQDTCCSFSYPFFWTDGLPIVILIPFPVCTVASQHITLLHHLMTACRKQANILYWGNGLSSCIVSIKFCLRFVLAMFKYSKAILMFSVNYSLMTYYVKSWFGGCKHINSSPVNV